MSSYIRRKDAEFVLESWKIGTFILDPIPNADVRENVRGEWIDSKLQQIAMRAFIEKGENWKVCSVCGTGFMIGHQYEFEKLYHDTFHNFCPNCGADMRGDNQ